MRVTYNWLKDFLDLRIPPKALAEKLTMAGLEVTALEERDGDVVFEIEITSNRPDWLSVIGIAREVAAITNSKYRAYSVERIAGSKKLYAKRYPLNAKNLQLKIENKKDCPLYTAKIIRGVKVGASADWLRKRLELVGCRSINNIVDITNYILFEWGEPLHAFDLDKLAGDTIAVRRAQADETITTIDGVQRALHPEVLIIADKERPVAIAGIMGGRDTEVNQSTKNILLEAALFNPIVVRRGRQKLCIQSESSYRFERGVDLKTVQSASWQAAKLIKELCQGECVLAKSAGITRVRNKAVSLSLENTGKILGVDIAPAKIRNILTRLDFKLKPRGKNNLLVSVPSYRQDVKLEIDLVEEVARAYGYERIPASLPKVSPGLVIPGTRSLVSVIKNILVGLGLNEVITYSLIERGLAKQFAPDPLGILNPLSREQEVLRPAIIPGLLNCIAVNLNQKQPFINIFEIAEAFGGTADNPKEELALGIALSGVKTALVAEYGAVREEAGFLHLKGILEALFSRLGIKNYSFAGASSPSEFSVYIGKEPMGKLVKVARHVLDEFGIKNKDVFVLEVALGRLIHFVKQEKKFQPPPLYPAIVRDISFVLKENIRVDDVLRAVRERGGSLLEEAGIADYYKGRQIPSGFRGLTVSCVYRSQDRTLTEAEINPVHSLVCAVLKDRFGAQLR